jgi:hypothetical protein
MANLFFPQLHGGSLVQYPLRKARAGRTIRNVLPDGQLILLPDSDDTRVIWELGYNGLSIDDLNLLSDHFTACAGRLRAFTFIDPTGNMLVNSSNLLGAGWVAAPGIQIASGVADPMGGASAFTITNTAQVEQEVSQTLTVPAGYQYCFSTYLKSAQPDQIVLVRRGAQAEQAAVSATGLNWSRAMTSGAVNDSGTSFAVAIRLSPGQQIQLFGPQLEAQTAPSRYRATSQTGGVYAGAHWGVDELPVSADAPGMFSTVFSIEAALSKA